MIRWALIVGSQVLVGLMAGWVMGLVLRAVSADYVVVPSDYVALGGRLGLLSGAILAAATLISTRPAPATRPLARATLDVVLTATFLPCVAAVGLMSLTMLPRFAPRFDQIAHPRRYILFLMLHHGWVAGMAIGTAIGATRLWRHRGLSVA